MILSIATLCFKCHYSECHYDYAEFYNLYFVMLNVVILSVVVLSVVMLNVIIMSVNMLGVVMLSVMAPFTRLVSPCFQCLPKVDASYTKHPTLLGPKLTAK
jgi:hypothetical protein